MQSIDQIIPCVFCNIRQKQMEVIAQCGGLKLAGVEVSHLSGYRWQVAVGHSRVELDLRNPAAVAGAIDAKDPIFQVLEEIHLQLGYVHGGV